MKPSSSIQNSLQKCEKSKHGSFTLFLLLSSFQEELKSALTRLMRSALVIRGNHAGNSVRIFFNECVTNNRIFTGFLFWGFGALAYQAHRFFIFNELPSVFAFIPDPWVDKSEWYYRCWFMYFASLRSHLAGLFALTGLFLIWPTKSGYRWAIVPLIAFVFSEIIHLSFFVDNWSGFYDAPWLQVLAVVAVSIYPLYRLVDYVAYRNYHLKSGSVCRALGLLDADNIDDSVKVKHLKTVRDEIAQFNARI
jgi:hypothetical protein